MAKTKANPFKENTINNVLIRIPGIESSHYFYRNIEMGCPKMDC
jgi:hypothetical protein